MLIKSAKLEDRVKYFQWMGGCAQLALVLGIVLSKLDNPHPLVNFASGILIGFSMVGNLAFIYTISRSKLRSEK